MNLLAGLGIYFDVQLNNALASSSLPGGVLGGEEDGANKAFASSSLPGGVLGGAADDDDGANKASASSSLFGGVGGRNNASASSSLPRGVLGSADEEEMVTVSDSIRSHSPTAVADGWVLLAKMSAISSSEAGGVVI